VDPMNVDPMNVVERWWAVWRDGDLDSLDEILAEPFVRHSSRGSVVRTRKQARDDMVQFRETLELAEVRFDAMTVGGDQVWCRVTTMGVNLATEEPSTMSWLQNCRVVDGRIEEMWWLYVLDVDWSKT
jgi:ketosteroid isomerase-like protein